MTAIVLVSHSGKIAEGLSEMIGQMVRGSTAVKIVPCGGTEDGRLGTDAMKILDALTASHDASSILVFCDIGSSVMSASSAVDLLEDEALKKKVVLVDAPLVEGAFAAGVTATTTDDVQAILTQVDEAKKTKKFD